MTLLAPDVVSAALRTRYGLSTDEATAVIARFGHQAEDHCQAVVRRLRADLQTIQGATFTLSNDIPSLVLAKHEAVIGLMLHTKPEVLTKR